MFSLYDIELYCGIDQYVITNIGIRKFKYSLCDRNDWWANYKLRSK